MSSPAPRDRDLRRPLSRDRDLKRVLLGCVFVAAFATFPGWAQTVKPSPVGKVDGERFLPVLTSGTRLESSSRAGASPDELSGLIAALEGELAAVRGTERTEAERLFVRAMSDAARAYISGAGVWAGYTDETRRAEASEAAARFGVETVLWTTPDKFRIILDDGSAFVRAASHFYAGRIGDGLAAEHKLFERIATRKTAGMKRALTPGEAESIRSRLDSDSVEDRRSAAVDALGFGKSAARFAPRLRQLTRDPDPVVRNAAIDALARIEAR